MTQINYAEEHRKLWSWLADHPGAHKADYLAARCDGDWPYNLCFACEAARLNGSTPNDDLCSSDWYCPLGGARVVGCEDGLYNDWHRATSLETRRKLALQIANLPWDGKEKNND